MALETNIIEFPFTQGQNEGVQRELLPLGHFSYLENVRYRRSNRLGKRNGYSALPTTDLNSTTIGGTPTLLTAWGDNYVAVDDRFYLYDDNGAAWSDTENQLDSGANRPRTLVDRWPQFMPGAAFAPIHQLNELDLYTGGGTALQTTAGMAYWDGILYVLWCYRKFSAVGNGMWCIRVHGVDPDTGRTVFRQELGTSGAVTDPQQPHLVATASSGLALVQDHFTAGVKDGLRIKIMTSRATGFPSTEYTVACTESAVNRYIGDANHILIAYADGTNNLYAGKWHLGTQAFTTTTTTATGADGIPRKLSIFGDSTGSTFVGWQGTTSGATKIKGYNSSLASSGATAALSALFGAGTNPEPPVLFAPRSGSVTTVVAIMHSATAGMCMNDMVASGGMATGDPVMQPACRPISWPFAVGASTYVWVRHSADAQVGVATLVRIPSSSELGAVLSPYHKAFPIEATLDDEDIDPPVAIGVSGPTYPTPVSTTLGYVACLTPTASTIVGPGPATYEITQPLVVPVRHTSESLHARQVCSVSVLGKTFVPSAQPMFVDSGGAVEAGFVQAPSGATVNSVAGGGSLTSSSRYQYAATFDYEDVNGRLERSAPCLPVVATLGAGDSRATVSFNALELSKKALRCNVYRTLANQSTFYRLTTVEGSPTLNVQNAGTNYFTVVDTAADTVVGANEQLYVQIGQELADSQFPACQFATVGGERLWVGGGFKANVVQASKPFLPRMSVAFADDDAFRVMLPGACTGLAYLDNLVAFTAEGIYVATGDGPDVAGVGSFSLTRLPFSIGCVNWRSVVATDEGIFFQSERGMCLLPRGFAEPIHMDQVSATLAAYPAITSVAAVRSEVATLADSYLPPERTIQWVCGNTNDAASGSAFSDSRILVYDSIRKLWSVDSLGGSSPAFITAWNGGRAIACKALSGQTHPLRLDDAGFDDDGTAVQMKARTGDIRPWGTFAHGVINRVGLLYEMRASVTTSMTVASTTENGSRTATRTHTTGDPDTAAGTICYLDVELGKTTLRDVNFLRAEITQSSTNEGMALIGMVIEHDVKPQGFKVLASRSRVT